MKASEEVKTALTEGCWRFFVSDLCFVYLQSWLRFPFFNDDYRRIYLLKLAVISLHADVNARASWVACSPFSVFRHRFFFFLRREATTRLAFISASTLTSVWCSYLLICTLSMNIQILRVLSHWVFLLRSECNCSQCLPVGLNWFLSNPGALTSSIICTPQNRKQNVINILYFFIKLMPSCTAE